MTAGALFLKADGTLTIDINLPKMGVIRIVQPSRAFLPGLDQLTEDTAATLRFRFTDWTDPGAGQVIQWLYASQWYPFSSRSVCVSVCACGKKIFEARLSVSTTRSTRSTEYGVIIKKWSDVTRTNLD